MTAREKRSKSTLDQLHDAPKQRAEIYRGFAGQDNKQPKLPAQVFSPADRQLHESSMPR